MSYQQRRSRTAPYVNKLTEARKKELKKKRDADRKPAKGIFKNYEVPGGMLKFSIRLHAGDPIETFELRDGEVYTLPIGIAKHLNKNCWYPVHRWAVDEAGKKHARVGQKLHRFGFQSLEFTDIADLHENQPDKQIVMIESV